MNDGMLTQELFDLFCEADEVDENPEPRICLDCGRTIDTGSDEDCGCPEEA